MLTIPKGRQHDGESSVDAALRELREETGIVLNPSHLTIPYVDRYIGTDGNTYTTYIYGAFLKERPTINLSSEFSSYTWISLVE